MKDKEDIVFPEIKFPEIKFPEIKFPEIRVPAENFSRVETTVVYRDGKQTTKKVVADNPKVVETEEKTVVEKNTHQEAKRLESIETSLALIDRSLVLKNYLLMAVIALLATVLTAQIYMMGLIEVKLNRGVEQSGSSRGS